MRFPACSRKTKHNFFTQFHTTWEAFFRGSLYCCLLWHVAKCTSPPSVTCSRLRNMYKGLHLRRRRGSPSMHASLILASVCERRIGGEGLFLFLFLTLALLAVTPRNSHPHPLPRSEARESNKATWVVAYLVLLLFSPSFHLSSSLFLLLSLSFCL